MAALTLGSDAWAARSESFRITGTVTSAGAPNAACVAAHLLRRDGALSNTVYESIPDQAGVPGGYEITVSRAGRYVLEVTDCIEHVFPTEWWEESADVAHASVIELGRDTPAATADPNLGDPTETHATARGTVTRADGSAAAGVCVAVLPYREYSTGMVVLTDAQGRFRIETDDIPLCDLWIYACDAATPLDARYTQPLLTRSSPSGRTLLVDVTLT